MLLKTAYLYKTLLLLPIICPQEIIDNPTPTPLFMGYAAVLLFVGTGGAI